MIMVMMNCYFGMIDRRYMLSLTSCQDHCQRISALRIPDIPRVGFASAQNLNSEVEKKDERSCASVTTTILRRHKHIPELVFILTVLMFVFLFHIHFALVTLNLWLDFCISIKTLSILRLKIISKRANSEYMFRLRNVTRNEL